jgi:hypothetical protein
MKRLLSLLGKAIGWFFELLIDLSAWSIENYRVTVPLIVAIEVVLVLGAWEGTWSWWMLTAPPVAVVGMFAFLILGLCLAFAKDAMDEFDQDSYLYEEERASA